MNEVGRIKLSAEMWREGGAWRLIVNTPSWLAFDYGREADGKRLWLANYGGGDTSGSFLVTVKDPEEALQDLQQFADEVEKRLHEMRQALSGGGTELIGSGVHEYIGRLIQNMPEGSSLTRDKKGYWRLNTPLQSYSSYSNLVDAVRPLKPQEEEVTDEKSASHK